MPGTSQQRLVKDSCCDDFAAKLATSGLTNTTVKSSPTTVRVDAVFNGQFLRKVQPQSYTAKQGSSGKTK